MDKYFEQAKKYRMIYDIHTHTTFSHGKGSIEDNVKAAISKGLTTIGISDHGPGHIFYGVKRKNLPVMKAEIERLSKLYPQIEILLGVEANIVNLSGRLDLKEADEKHLDYILAGFHYGIFGENPLFGIRLQLANLASRKLKFLSWKKLKTTNTDLVIKAIYENKIKLITHPGDKGPFDLLPIAEACVANNTMMEISTWHLAPTLDELRSLSKTGVRYIISSDAHSPERVGTYIPGLKRALEAGVDPALIDNIEEV